MFDDIKLLIINNEDSRRGARTKSQEQDERINRIARFDVTRALWTL